MKIEIRLFASLACYGSHGDLDSDGCLSFEASVTIRDAIQRLGVPENQIKLVFLNGVAASLDADLKDQDRVGIFPPIGGG